MNQNLFEMAFELVDVESCEETGYENVYDLSVDLDHSFLLSSGLVSHNSALGSLIPTLGRKECGYYCLKGVPLNAYSAPQDKFTKNKELSELYTIIQNEQYEHIIIGADADCDGNHIIGLLFGFFKRYFPELTDGHVGKLQTPVIQITKKDKIVRWMYSLTDKIPLKPGEESHYMKGLGSWDSGDLKEIVKADGLGKMIQIMDFTGSDEILEDWLGDDSEPRKKHILANDFSITDV